MNSIPKTIQIFLPDGNPKGIKIAEITSRKVQAVFVPRYQLDELRNRDEGANVGLYFLFGLDEETEEPEVYIGEAENCYERLKQHHKDKGKDFWNVAIIIIINSSQNQFTKSDVKYLENKSFDYAKEMGSFKMKQTIPAKSRVDEWKEADLKDYFETIKILISFLGYSLFDPLRKTESKRIDANENLKEDEEIFYCKGRGVEASGQIVTDGFVVFKGSEMALEPVASFKNYIPLRNRVIADKTVEKIGDKYIFTKDYKFTSPSGASAIILGTAKNGWKDWKTKSGITLEELKRK